MKKSTEKSKSSGKSKSKKTKSSTSLKSVKSKNNSYKMKPNEFLFIYNLYTFEKLHFRPKNEIKLYYFIKPDWIKLFKEFFNCKEIYKILNKNIKNDYFLNLIKAENIPDEFSKIKCSGDKIPNELYDYEYNREYLINLNEEDTKVSYYPFKVFILEESLNNAFDIDGKSFKFQKGKQGIMFKNTFYGIINEKILEIFTYNDESGLFDPFCLFCYNYKNDLYTDLNNVFKYKEIKEFLEEIDLLKNQYPKFIRDSDQNVIGKIIYLLGDDAPNNVDKFITEYKKESELKDFLMKEFEKKIKEERMRETKRILKENKKKEKEEKEEKKKDREEIKKRIKKNKEKIKEEMAQKEFQETLMSKKFKKKLMKEKEKEKEEEEIRKKEIEERMEKEKEEKEKQEQIEKENKRLHKEKLKKEREEMIRLETEQLETEIKETERKQESKIKREKELYEKIREETQKLDEEKAQRLAEKQRKEEAERIRLETEIMEKEEREKKIKEEYEAKRQLKKIKREEEKKRIREGFERLNKIKQEEKLKEDLNRQKIKKEIKEKKYWEKIKEETNKLERERMKRDQEQILRKKIIQDTFNLISHRDFIIEKKEISPESSINQSFEKEKLFQSKQKKNKTKSINSSIKSSYIDNDSASEVVKRFIKIKKETEKSKFNKDDDNEIIYDGTDPNVGLKNVEAMCYMNATIQCFSKTIELTKYFLRPYNKNRIFFNNSLLKDENNLELSTSYYEIIKNLWNRKNENKSFSPTNFKEKLRKMNSLFIGYNSGEPKDLISFILLKLHEELNVVKKKKEPENKNKLHSKYNMYDRFNVLNEFLIDTKIKNNSIISDLFYGIIENISECLICKEQNKNKGLTRKFKYEFKNIKYLTFPLEEVRKFRNNKFLKNNADKMTPNMMTDIINNNRVFIQDCFEYYQNPIILTDEDQIYCEVCQKKTNANFVSKIYYPPNIMIIILDRGENIKYKVGINFEETIDITQFIDKEFTIESRIEYELYGVITFIGENIKTGKYIAFGKSNNKNKKWVCYNDENVVEIVDFMSQVHDYGLPSVLFYERIIL